MRLYYCFLLRVTEGRSPETPFALFFKSKVMMNVKVKYVREKTKARSSPNQRFLAICLSEKLHLFPFCPTLIVSPINPLWDCVINWMLLICHKKKLAANAWDYERAICKINLIKHEVICLQKNLHRWTIWALLIPNDIGELDAKYLIQHRV